MRVNLDEKILAGKTRTRDRLKLTSTGAPVYLSMVTMLPMTRSFIYAWFKKHGLFVERLPKQDEPFVNPIRMYNRLLLAKEVDNLKPTILPGMASISREEIPIEGSKGRRIINGKLVMLDAFSWIPWYKLEVTLGDQFTTGIQDLTVSTGLKGVGAKHMSNVLKEMLRLHPIGKYYEHTKKR